MYSLNSGVKSDVKVRNFEAGPQKDFYQHWLGVKGERILPASNDLDPEYMADYISQIILIDYHEKDDEFSFRLMDQDLREILEELSEQDLKEGSSRLNLFDSFKWCIENKEPYYSKHNIELAFKDYSNYSSVVYPLSDNNKDVTNLVLVVHLN
ncbi:hypothetical protein [Pseudemcibacter aquimaris]|uniref:hypothetical protein n=1 Tax=Pseudemcibacter aquimaris TaxID=2857064 RepID=UPI0020126518|nr:hypothetical protein [Pseudemcibacter aquimaris]MCC3862373.1 hypothetical protein [Pseudemcibacter aquimaris]WDU59196.1 hypothetical protein KW060_02800 [Pseudemcibacter aquimaris]